MCFDLILNYITWKTNIVSHNEADCFGPDVVLNPFSPFTKSEAPTRFEPMTSARPVDALPTELWSFVGSRSRSLLQVKVTTILYPQFIYDLYHTHIIIPSLVWHVLLSFRCTIFPVRSRLPARINTWKVSANTPSPPACWNAAPTMSYEVANVVHTT